MKNLKIGVKLGTGFGLVIFFVIVVIGSAISMVKFNNDMNEHISTQLVTEERMVREWYTLTTANSIRTSSRIMSTDANYENQLKQEMGESSKKISAIQEKFENLVKEPEVKKLLETVASKRKEYVSIRETIFKAKANGDQAAVTELMAAKFVPGLREYESSILAIAEHYEARIKYLVKEMDSKIQSEIMMYFVAAIVVSIVGSWATWWFVKQITRPLNEALKIAESVAAGKLDISIVSTTKDETGQLLTALGKMRDSLEKIVYGIRSGTESIVTNSQQIASGNSELSQRTEEQASSLQQTAASMEEITSTVQHNAQNASQANEQAKTASEITKKGGQSVNQVVDTMNSINESSRKIVEIISVIDSIAFQTNILALNAAVEAARAGDQGRGFAVVAAEVRTLAQRSATAAKEIKSLINDSVERVESGIRQVGEAGHEMNGIMHSIQVVQEMVSTISVATQEQSSGIGEVNVAIAQIDKVTQQNAALVEEAAAAAESLRDQAEKLAKLVSVFSIRKTPPNGRANFA